jgi:hypothetical protein
VSKPVRFHVLALVLVGLGVLALSLTRRDEPTEAPEVEPPGPAPLPLPEIEPEDPVEQARGIYMLKTSEAQFSLDLRGDRSFVFVSVARGGRRRTARGTWGLGGTHLTLAYTHVDGQPLPDAPVVATNRWTGQAVELLDAPATLGGRPVLIRQTVIRER